MTPESLNFRVKDIVQYAVYLVTLTLFIVSINNKVDNVSEVLAELKADRKDYGNEYKATNLLIQNDLKTLTIRAELNRQNIELNKADIEMLKFKVDKILNR